MASGMVCIRYVGVRVGSSYYDTESGNKYLFGQNARNAIAVIEAEDAQWLMDNNPLSFVRIPLEKMRDRLELQAPLPSVTKIISDGEKESLMKSGLQTVGQILTLSDRELAEIGIADPNELLYQVRFRFGLVKKRPKKQEPDSKTG